MEIYLYHTLYIYFLKSRILDCFMQLSSQSYNTAPGLSFPVIIFTLYMERQPMYYVYNIITPSILCIAVALVGYMLPPDSGEKVSLSVTVLLAFSVFQLVVADKTPHTSDHIPMLSKVFIILNL